MSNRRLVDLLFKAMIGLLSLLMFVIVELVITVFTFSAQKGLIGPAGMPGPAGPKGERVSINYMFVFCFYFYGNICLIEKFCTLDCLDTIG